MCMRSLAGHDATPKPIYSVAELAELAGLSRHQVARLLARNHVPVARLGRKVLVPLAALRRALPWVVDSIAESGRLGAA
jgi:excisionase family DNA binding protein